MFINEDDYITTLELFDPETRRNETITTTPEHPFYVSSKEKEPWTDAGELEVDDEIRKADGNVGIVLFVRTKLQKKTMYNLSVSDNHNFFVGDQGWLTHNCDIDPSKIRKTKHAEDRANQAKEGDSHRNVGNWSRVLQEGRQFKDIETGNIVFVRGDQVVITSPDKARIITQFKNTRENTLQRIRNGKWEPK